MLKCNDFYKPEIIYVSTVKRQLSRYGPWPHVTNMYTWLPNNEWINLLIWPDTLLDENVTFMHCLQRVLTFWGKYISSQHPGQTNWKITNVNKLLNLSVTFSFDLANLQGNLSAWKRRKWQQLTSWLAYALVILATWSLILKAQRIIPA